MTDAILTCSEHFTDFALNELRRQHPHITLLDTLSPRHLLLSFPGTFGDLTRYWRDRLPLYLHHLFPVQRTIPLTGTAADFACLRGLRQTLCPDDCFVQVRVEGDYPYSAVALEQALAPGQRFSRSNPPSGRALSILVTPQRAYLGVSWDSQQIAGASFIPRYFDEPVPNRAGLKLLEALETFHIRLRPADRALDLGAAPGAWTEVLRRRGLQITAVAPRSMYDWLQGDPNVRAFYLTAEDYLTQCDDTYDLICNDMKLDAQESARLMVGYARHLPPQGIGIMTLKLRMRDPRRVMDHTFRLLRKAYRIVRVRQLVSNRKEVTLFLRRNA